MVFNCYTIQIPLWCSLDPSLLNAFTSCYETVLVSRKWVSHLFAEITTYVSSFSSDMMCHICINFTRKRKLILLWTFGGLFQRRIGRSCRRECSAIPWLSKFMMVCSSLSLGHVLKFSNTCRTSEGKMVHEILARGVLYVSLSHLKLSNIFFFTGFEGKGSCKTYCLWSKFLVMECEINHNCNSFLAKFRIWVLNMQLAGCRANVHWLISILQWSYIF